MMAYSHVLIGVVFACVGLWLVYRHEESASSVTEPNSEFCYINHFDRSDYFRTVTAVLLERANEEFVRKSMHSGQPFVVSGVTKDWLANWKWSHAYFEEIFQNHNLFSSTFATSKQPQFSESPSSNVYFGIFLNDHRLSEVVAGDYSYPLFIPQDWRLTGNEWLHWGYPPCGAKRHMDLGCSSRVSVQVGGAKHWRLHPLVNVTELQKLGLGNWSQVLQPLEVTLHPGDALVWFPGWEHETRILTGPSISLSLHFLSPGDSTYQNTFSHALKHKVSSSCQWEHQS